jgi:hypothetical protein
MLANQHATGPARPVTVATAPAGIVIEPLVNQREKATASARPRVPSAIAAIGPPSPGKGAEKSGCPESSVSA